VSVSAPLSLGLTICVLAAIIPLYEAIHQWNDKSSQAIANMNLAASTTRLSKINENLQVVYDQLTHDLGTLRNTTYMHLEHRQPVLQYFRPYYAGTSPDGAAKNVDTTDSPTEDVLLMTKPVSTYSGLWKLGVTDYSEIVANTAYVNESGLVDPLMRAMYKANAGSGAASTNFLYKLMLGFENGLYRRYPYSRFNVDYGYSKAYCADAPAPLHSLAGYDPRCRPWYQQSAVLAKLGVAREDTVVFSAPYVDAASGLPTISASSPLFRRTDGTFLGVVNVDWNLNYVSHTTRAPAHRESEEMFGRVLMWSSSLFCSS
jgi:hypothetical protein